MSKISIIVPVYNSEQYLEKCLLSIIQQTFTNIEIIIVNDGSTDKSKLIIEKYAAMDNRIIVLDKPNGGLGDARNFGISHASGDYIAFVDSDDYIDSTMFEKTYNKAIATNADIVECDFYWSYEKRNVIDIKKYSNDKENLLLNVRVLVCNKLFKKDLIINNKINFPVGLLYEDILFTYKALLNCNNYEYVNDALYYYVQRKISLSNHQTARVRDIFKILKMVKEYYSDNHKLDPVVEYVFIRYLLGSSFMRIINIDDKKLRKDILKENWKFLNNEFPRWNKNKCLKIISLKNVYYRFTNKFTYIIFSKIFKLKSRFYK
jgi:glycosyltransferase involved in cell wall biosynthesis